MKNSLRDVIVWIFMGLFGLILSVSFIIFANSYQNMVKQAEKELDTLIIRLYLTQRMEQLNQDSKIQVKEFNGREALVLSYPDYYVLLYEEDGYLIEQNSITEQIFPRSGERIARIQRLTMQYKDKKLRFVFLKENNQVMEINLVTLNGRAP
jgi:hypothetical protein